MNNKPQLVSMKCAIVSGEESGDRLGADLIMNLRTVLGVQVNLIGVGGEKLEHLGLKSFFPSKTLSVMGLWAVIKKLPQLIFYLNSLARYVARQNPDVLIIIDSPDFTHRLAKKVRRLNPAIPIVKYVAPSVWAWRPERAAEMTKFIDHILAILPFEEKILQQLSGPKTTYVGHYLLTYKPVIQAKEKQIKRHLVAISHSQGDTNVTQQEQILNLAEKRVLLLPGSRFSEIEQLLPVFRDAVAQMHKIQKRIRFILVTLPHLRPFIEEAVKDWTQPPRIVCDEEEKWQVFSEADVALAASGTVSLELALCCVPMVLAYKMDYFAKRFILPRLKNWTAALPNLVFGDPIVPEFFNEFARADVLAHHILHLLKNSSARRVQFLGFFAMSKMMATESRSGKKAAEIVYKICQKQAEQGAKNMAPQEVHLPRAV